MIFKDNKPNTKMNIPTSFDHLSSSFLSSKDIQELFNTVTQLSEVNDAKDIFDKLYSSNDLLSSAHLVTLLLVVFTVVIANQKKESESFNLHLKLFDQEYIFQILKDKVRALEISSSKL